MTAHPEPWRPIDSSWKSRDEDTRIEVQSINGRVTLPDLIKHIAEVVPENTEVTVSGTIRWTRPASTEEKAAREEWRTVVAERTERWERATIVRLAEKYGYVQAGGTQ